MPFLLLLAGCNLVTSLLNNPKTELADADAALKAGDLAKAATAYEAAVKKAPTDVDAASGAAYIKLLQGDLDGADTLLAAAEANAGDRKKEIQLRRALVELQRGDKADLQKLGQTAEASGLPLGKLLAAEAALADGDRDKAKGYLDGIKSEAGPVGEVATEYLNLLGDSSPPVQGISETQALWALGQRKIAVRSAEDLVKIYAETKEDGPEQLLLWAGRAAVVGEVGVANSLLDVITVPPPGQGWRVQATRAVALCAEGKGADCLALLKTLEAGAPSDGLANAKATAAVAIAEQDAETAKAILAGVPGDASARVLAFLGDKSGAAAVAEDPVLKTQLGG